MHKSLNKKERMSIFELFLKNERLKFSDIEKQLKIRSNAVAYHLESMRKDELIEKKGEYYLLTHKAESYLPLARSDAIGPIPVILAAIVHNDKILLIKRGTRPYRNYWSLIGGKILLHEDIKTAALRKAREETGIECEFKSLNAVLHERVDTDNNIKHSFILFFVKLRPKTLKSKENTRWFSMKKLNEREIIPTDYFLIKNNINSIIMIHDAHMSDDENRLQLTRLGKI